jgi:hemoglobin-like flavoprotein
MPEFEATDMENQDTRLVRQSFGRCTLNDDFLVTFYDLLTQSSGEIKAMFAHTDMPRQRQLLKGALIHLISYAGGNEFSRDRINELGESHSRTHLNVRPDLYEIWVDSLVNAVRRHDPNATPELEAAWRRIVAPGIALMQSRYSPENQ